MSFSLLKLPMLASEVVLQNMSFEEIIEFSLCSRRCERLVILTRHQYTSISIFVYEGSRTVYLSVGNRREVGQWTCGLKPLKRGEEPDRNDVRKISGVDVRISKFRFAIFSQKTPELQFKLIFGYIQKLFRNLPVQNIIFDSSRNRKLLPHCLGIQKCETMRIIVDKKPIHGDVIHELLQNVQCTKSLSLTIIDSPDFRMDSVGFSVDKLHIWQAQWLTRQTFLSMDCARIDLSRVTLKSQDFVDFVSQWFHSTSTRLVCLKVSPLLWLDTSRFQTKPWDSAIRGRYFGFTETDSASVTKIDCSEAMDITRSDGLILTIVRKHSHTCFVVWHDRFPHVDHFPDDPRIV